ncbi:MAG: MotA/TolQ/ExbB proton channel family protein [Planctomycetota bacterium]
MPLQFPLLALLQGGSAAAQTPSVDSLFELIKAGGPLMIPIGLCSVAALAFAVERWLRLQPMAIGSQKLGAEIAEATRAGGAKAGLDACGARKKPLERILAAGLERSHMAFADREKVVEDTAGAEVRLLGRNLRPLFLVWLIAPLLGLLGTVWGMIEAFSNIALTSGIGKPEQLARGIYVALTTTAAGLTVAIPTIVFYWVLQGRIERFAATSEEAYRAVDSALSEHARGGAAASAAQRQEG